MTRPVIAAQGLTKTYGEKEASVHALQGVSFVVKRGEFVAIVGSSGSGKSTLMNLLGCLDVPTSGTYRLDGVRVRELPENVLSVIRNLKIGFIFQGFNLIPRTTALENVELPLVYAGVNKRERRERRQRALAALDSVGLSDRVDHQPSELSGGQQQRVAVARALVTEPSLLLADEPTGNLDTHATNDILQVFDDLNAQGKTIVLITHEHDVAQRTRRVIELQDGHIIQDINASEYERLAV